MQCANDRSPPPRPEWRRSGPFFLLALAVHAAILFYPLKVAIGHLDIPPLATVIVRFAETARPKPLPVAPRPPPPKPVDHPPKLPARQQHVLAVPTPKPATPMPAPTSPAPKTAAASAPTAAPAPAETAPPAAATVPSPPAAPVVSPARYNAAYLNNPPPAYPMLSRRLGEEGRVLLKVRVGPDGLPVAVDLEKSSNFPRLDKAAEESVRHWRFVPARQGDQAIVASLIVPIVFKLE